MKKSLYLWALMLLAAACATAPGVEPVRLATSGEPTSAQSPSPQPTTPKPLAEVTLKNHGPAPELTNEVWLNTDKPLRLTDLRGKVVLIDFWTFG